MKITALRSDEAIYQDAWRVIYHLPEFIVDQGGHLLWSNDAFQRELADGQVFRLQDKLVVFFDRSAQCGFLTFLTSLGPAPAAWMTGTPLEGCQMVFRGTLVQPQDLPAGVAFTIYDHRQPAVPLWGDFRSLFGLTASEFQIARRLMEGETLVRVAHCFGITTETSKTHLRRIYAKLEVGSREEFYSKLARFRVF